MTRTKRPWTATTVALLALVAAACGSPSASPGVQAPGDASDLVFLRTRAGITVVDGKGAPRPAAGSLAIPGSSIVIAVGETPGGQSIKSVDAVTGEMLDEAPAPAGLVPRVASRTGELVALAHAAHYEGVLGLPTGRSETRIAVADFVRDRVRELELKGNFEPEAFSSDGRILYAIEYLPARNPTRYGVRAVHVRSGRVTAVGDADKGPSAPEEMKGTGRAQVPSPDGGVLYTLYTRQGPNTAHEADGAASETDVDPEGGDTHSFVHVLNLDEGWAHCVDLPHPFGEDSVAAHALAVTPNGERVYVADFAAGEIAVINTDNLRVLRTATVDLPEEAPPAAAAGEDLYLAEGSGVLVIDGSSLEHVGHFDVGATVTGLGVDADGSSLYVTTGDGVAVIDLADGEVTVEFPAPGAEGIAHIAHTARS